MTLSNRSTDWPEMRDDSDWLLALRASRFAGRDECAVTWPSDGCVKTCHKITIDAVTAVCGKCGPWALQTCPVHLQELMGAFYLGSIAVHCPQGHRINSITETPMTQTIEEIDTSILAAYDLALDKRCRFSPHPDHVACGAIAVYAVAGLDTFCDLEIVRYFCEEHVYKFWQAMHEGRWCACTPHQGHTCERITIRRLV